jgi:hypothetical protein
MAFKVTKDEKAAIDAAVDAALRAKEAFEAEVDRVNAKLDELRDELAGKVSAYNEAVESVSAVAQELVDRLRGEYDDKSEKWQESERAEAVSSWIDDLENLTRHDSLDAEVSDVSVEEPEWVDDKFNESFRDQPEE